MLKTPPAQKALCPQKAAVSLPHLSTDCQLATFYTLHTNCCLLKHLHASTNSTATSNTQKQAELRTHAPNPYLPYRLKQDTIFPSSLGQSFTCPHPTAALHPAGSQHCPSPQQQHQSLAQHLLHKGKKAGS